MQEGLRSRTEPAEPNRTEPFNFRTGRKRTRNRNEPSHDVYKKRRPNHVEPGNLIYSKPNRTDQFSKRPEPKRIEPNRFLPGLCDDDLEWHGSHSRFKGLSWNNWDDCGQSTLFLGSWPKTVTTGWSKGMPPASCLCTLTALPDESEQSLS